MQGNYRDIIKLATPILLGGVAQNSIAFADTAMLARYGEVELAAVGPVSMYYLMIFMAGFAYTKGTQILTARRLGEQDLPAIGSIFSNSMVVLLALGITMFAILRFGSEHTMSFFFKDPLLMAAAVEYLEIRAYGIIFSFIGSVYLSFYMGLGTMQVLVYAMLIMSSVNIGLNYVFIFGAFGLPAMGIKGAALASNVAEVLVTTIMTFYMLRNKLHVKYNVFRRRILSWNVVGTLTSISLPIVALTIVGLLGWMVFMYYVEKMGAFETQVSNIAKSLYMFFGLPAWAFSAAAGTIISNLMGRKLYPRVIEAMKNIVVLSFITTFILSLPLLFFPGFIVEYVIDPELPALIPASVPVIHITVVALLIYSVSTVMFHGIVSTGSVKVSLLIEVITVAIYLAFIVWIFSLENATVALVWTSEIFYWLVLLLIAFLYFRSGHWKKTKI